MHKTADNKNSDFRLDVWVLNQTGVKIFIRVDEFQPGEISFTVSLAPLPALESSTLGVDVYEPGMQAVGEIFPERRNDPDLYQQHRLIMKDEEFIEVMTENKSGGRDKNSKLIIYTIKPKHSLPPSADDVGNN